MSDCLNQILAELESKKENARRGMSQLETDFMSLGAIHDFAVLAPPHADAGETELARHMKAGWLATSFVGVTTLAGLSTLSLNNGLPPVIFFSLSAVGSWLLRLVFDKAVVAILPADPKHPESLRRIRTVLTLSSIAVASSFAAFCWLRFAEDVMVLSLISPIALVFEGGLFAMAASFHAGEVVNGWSRKMAGKYEKVSAEHDKIQHLIKAYEQQLTNSSSRDDRKARSEEGGHNEIDIARYGSVSGHDHVVANKPNGREGMV